MERPSVFKGVLRRIPECPLIRLRMLERQRLSVQRLWHLNLRAQEVRCGEELAYHLREGLSVVE